MEAHHEAARTGSSSLPLSLGRQMLNVLSGSTWSAVAINRYLLHPTTHYTDQNGARIRGALLRSIKAPAILSLQDMVLGHWTRLSLSIAAAKVVQPPAASAAVSGAPAAPAAPGAASTPAAAGPCPEGLLDWGGGEAPGTFPYLEKSPAAC